MLNRPLIWVAGCFCTGIILQHALKASVDVLIIGALIIITVAAFSLSRQRNGVYLMLGLAAICGALWLAIAEIQHVSQFGELEGKRVNLHGTLASKPEQLKDKVICDILVDRFKLGAQEWQEIPREKVRVYFFRQEQEAGGQEQALAYGDVINLHGKLVLPQEKKNPGEFDYRQYLKFRGIYSLLYVYKAEEVAVEGKEGGNPLIAVSLGIRESFSGVVRASLPERQAVLLLAMLFGEQRAVFDADIDMFRELGIAHALSVSGFHVGLVLLLVFTICRLAGGGSRATLLVSLCALGVYCVLSAFTLTVIRAAIMGSIGLLAGYFDREKNIYIALAASGLSLLIWNPFFIFDAGFQLSFTAVWAMAYLEPVLRGLLPDCLYPRGSLLTVPLAAQLGTLPIVAWHFNMLSPLAILANILLVPVMSGIVILGLIAFIVSLGLSFAAELFLKPAGFLIEVLMLFAGYIRRLPGTVIFVAPPSLFFISLYYGLLVASKESLQGTVGMPGKLTYERFSPLTRQPFGIVVLIGALFLGAVSSWDGHRELRIFFLDVGQGDAMLIWSPSGRTVLVDGGGMPGFYAQGYDPGKDTVLPFLHSQGINRLDLVINTHPDEDHLDGLEDVLEEMPADKVITPPVRGWAEEYASFLKLARQQGADHLELTQGTRINLEEGVVIKVLGPGRSLSFESSNDNSLVLEVCHGSNRLLLLGDLEKEGINSLISGSNDLQCTLLKIPHHGGKGSFNEDLYKEARPDMVVISVGENNTFGHPAQEVVQYWREAGVSLYRTDRDGCVIVSSDGKKCAVETVR